VNDLGHSMSSEPAQFVSCRYSSFITVSTFKHHPDSCISYTFNKAIQTIR